MKRPKPVYLPVPPTIAELERLARQVRLMHILMWVVGVPVAIVVIVLATG